MAELFKLAGDLQGSNGFFVGDRLGRAFHSFGAFLLALKVRCPPLITLLNGNHGNRHITQVFGFYDECSSKYWTSAIWRHCTDAFNFLSLSALVDTMVSCVHCGLSPSIRTLLNTRNSAHARGVPSRTQVRHTLVRPRRNIGLEWKPQK
ncbi:hypothetical protein HPB48_009781 [Haemaphysalis longicornis]|uniref:protein-serine/threonine phosphatase n=1 Tax=Haemaphysalis longicornis TaxID=44386 RepID=A0A9J6GMW5_HAELO|nr:hypothetical protein HPB48_009781 [Haemaphysalis longicornis]